MKKTWLNDKTVIISGYSSGIGKEIAKILIYRYNCKIIGIARNPKKCEDFKLQLGDKSQNIISVNLFDVANESHWKGFANYLKDSEFKPDILINCAGMLPKFSKYDDYEIDDIKRVFDVNFFSAVYSAKYLADIIKKSETPAIINISSSSALATFAGISSYSASKSALKSFTMAIGEEYRGEMYVACVCPGFTSTDIFINQGIEEKEKSFVFKICTSSEKMGKMIVSRIRKRKRLSVLGYDAKLMNFFYKIMPVTTGKIITFILRKSNLKLFENI